MKAYARLFVEVLRANIAAVMEYRIPFLVQVFGMMLNNAAFLIFWAVLIRHTGSIGGWKFGDVLYLWALGPSAFGLAFVVFGNARQLGTLIVQGDLDVYLLQPKDPLFHALISRTVPSAWGDLIYGFLLLPFITHDPVRIGLFALFTVTGALVFVGFFSLVQSLAFWLGNITGLANAMTELMLNFTLYPETVFPQPMRWVFYTLIPAGFLAFLPIRVLRTLDWVWLPVIAAVALGLLVASAAVFRVGLRRYESGNALGGRA
jgi:ABC-2 type transport system permease protein